MEEIKEAVRLYMKLIESLIVGRPEGSFIDVVINVDENFEPPAELASEHPGATMRKVEVQQNLPMREAHDPAMKDIMLRFIKATSMLATAVFALNEKNDNVIKGKIHMRAEKMESGSVDLTNTMEDYVARDLDTLLEDLFVKYDLTMLREFIKDPEFMVQVMESKNSVVKDEDMDWAIGELRNKF